MYQLHCQLENSKQFSVNQYTKKYVLDFDEYFHLRCLLVQQKFHLVFQGDVFLVQSFEY